MKRFLTRSPWKWLLPGAAALLILYTIFGFFIAPALVVSQVPKALETRFDCRVELGEVDINPFALSIEARDFWMGFPDQTPFAGFKRLYLNFQLSSLFRWALTFKRVNLDRPYLGLVLMENGNLNLSRLNRADNATQSADRSEEANGEPLRLLLHHIEVSNGTLEFDNLRQSPPAAIAFDPIDLELANLSTLPEREGPYTLEADTGNGESMTWSGRLSLAPVWSNGTFVFSNVRTATLWEFFRGDTNLQPPGGTFDLATEYSLDTAKRLTFRCRDIDLDLEDLTLQLVTAKVPFLELPVSRIVNGVFDLNDRRLDLEQVTGVNGTLRLDVDANGTLNMQRLGGGQNVPPREEGSGTRPSSTRNGTAQDTPWRFTLQDILIDDLGLTYQDASRQDVLLATVKAPRLRAGMEVTAGTKGADLRLDGIDIALADIGLGTLESNATPLRIARAGLKEGRFDLKDRALSARDIFFQNGTFQVVREPDGINLVTLFSPKDLGALRRGKARAEQKERPWNFEAETMTLSGFTGSYSDATLNQPGTILGLREVRASSQGLNLRDPFPLSLSFDVDQGGAFAANGTVDPASGRVQAGLTLKGLALRPAQPYVDAVARLDLLSGALSLDGDLTAGGQGDGFPLELTASLDLTDLNIVEQEANATLLGWKRLHTDSLRLTLQPNGLTVDSVQLDQPRGRLLIDEEQQVNVVEVFKSQNGNATQPGQSGPDPSGSSDKDPFPVRIDSLRLSKGTLDFTDLNLILPFSATIHDLDGLISEITSSPGTAAGIDLAGQVDDYGVSEISGRMDFFDPKRFTDVSVVFENVPMTTLNPYTATFAGRKIESGKLHLDLEYNIQNATLRGENQIVVEELTLGETVQSERAVNLPLKLAVALLKDRSGTIDIGLPVQGDLNNPEFSFGHLIGRAIFNLLTKIVTSPFRILGALLPDLGSDDIDSVSFAPGRSDLAPPQKEKAVQLAQALSERPELALTVQGRWVPETDARGLRDLMLRRQLAAKMGRQLEGGEDPGPVNLESRTVLDKLKALYGERFGFGTMNELVRSLEADVDQNATGFAEGRGNQPLARELFERLRESQELPDGALEALALQRARTVVQVLAGQGGLDQERITTSPPEVLGENGTPVVSFSLDTVG